MPRWVRKAAARRRRWDGESGSLTTATARRVRNLSSIRAMTVSLTP